MDRETALTTLRLSKAPEPSEIISAYNRLARRYPLQQFPERHTRLNEAKSALLNPEIGFKGILTEEDLDLSWLDKHSTTPATEKPGPKEALSNPRQSVEVLMRPHFQEGADLLLQTFRDENPMELDPLIDDMDPNELRRMINQLLNK